MKKQFSIKHAVKSLLFPAFIFLIFGALFAIFISTNLVVFKWTCLISVLTGGLLPAVTTLITKADTSRFLKSRLITLSLCLALIAAAWLLNYLLDSIAPVWCALAILNVSLTIYYIRAAGSHLERFILTISNPIFYVTLCLIGFCLDLIALFS